MPRVIHCFKKGVHTASFTCAPERFDTVSRFLNAQFVTWFASNCMEP